MSEVTVNDRVSPKCVKDTCNIPNCVVCEGEKCLKCAH